MVWFRKKDVVDLTRLQKQGILQKVKEIESQGDDSVMDLSPSTPTSSSEDSNPLAGFFGNMDTGASASTTETNLSETKYGSYTDRLRAARSAKVSDINALKIKLEDTEYKLERALEKISIIESRLEEFERRIG